MPPIEKSCLCGAVKIIAEDVNPKFTVCHCQQCRSWGGGPYFAVKCGTNVKFQGEENVKTYQSSSWASRGFCSECGTHLFFKYKESGEYYVPVGLFPDFKGLEMDMQYFSDMRPNYYCFSNKTKEMATDEIMPHLAPDM